MPLSSWAAPALRPHLERGGDVSTCLADLLRGTRETEMAFKKKAWLLLHVLSHFVLPSGASFIDEESEARRGLCSRASAFLCVAWLTTAAD